MSFNNKHSSSSHGNRDTNANDAYMKYPYTSASYSFSNSSSWSRIGNHCESLSTNNTTTPHLQQQNHHLWHKSFPTFNSKSLPPDHNEFQRGEQVPLSESHRAYDESLGSNHHKNNNNTYTTLLESVKSEVSSFIPRRKDSYDNVFSDLSNSKATLQQYARTINKNHTDHVPNDVDRFEENVSQSKEGKEYLNMLNFFSNTPYSVPNTVYANNDSTIKNGRGSTQQKTTALPKSAQMLHNLKSAPKTAPENSFSDSEVMSKKFSKSVENFHTNIHKSGGDRGDDANFLNYNVAPISLNEHTSSSNHTNSLKHRVPLHVLEKNFDIESFKSSKSFDCQDSTISTSLTSTLSTTFPYGFWSRAVRKTGWLIVKHWLTIKKMRVSHASKRSWKRYWVCLKGPTLLFYSSSNPELPNSKKILHHVAVIEGGVAQPIPEYPKKENIFCLSIDSGDVFLLQASSNAETENWVHAIHNSCAASLARHHGKENIIKLILQEIETIEYSIEMDCKMKHMAEAQLMVVSDSNNRHAISKQLMQWESRIELNSFENFRYKCYVSSLKDMELPNPKKIIVPLSEVTTFDDLLFYLARKKKFNPSEYFIKLCNQSENFVPKGSHVVEKMDYTSIEVCQKSIFGIEISRKSLDEKFGFSIEAEIGSRFRKPDDLVVYVADVTTHSEGALKGLSVGDEILTINRKCVMDLDMMFVESILQNTLQAILTIRSCQLEPPKKNVHLKSCQSISSNQSLLSSGKNKSETEHSEKMSSSNVSNFLQNLKHGNAIPELTPEQLDSMLESAEHVTAFCQLLHGNNVSKVCDTKASNKPQNLPYENGILQDEKLQNALNTKLYSIPLSNCDKLKRAICELVETERTYVLDLKYFINRFLYPIMNVQTFDVPYEIKALSTSILQIFVDQEKFLMHLIGILERESKFQCYSKLENFMTILTSIGEAFLNYTHHFKDYSSLSANYSKCQKVLQCMSEKAPLRQFLTSQNSSNQHCESFESFLIKPIQRILKYPLLMFQIKQSLQPEACQCEALNQAHKSMQLVAQHINEMQKIHEEFGPYFDKISLQFYNTTGSSVELTIGNLLLCDHIDLLTPLLCENASTNVLQAKAFCALPCICFVFKTSILLLIINSDKMKDKRKKSVTQSRETYSIDESLIKNHILILMNEVSKCRILFNEESSSSCVPESHLWCIVHAFSNIKANTKTENLYRFATRSPGLRKRFVETINQFMLKESQSSSEYTHHLATKNSASHQVTFLPEMDAKDCTNLFKEKF